MVARYKTIFLTFSVDYSSNVIIILIKWIIQCTLRAWGRLRVCVCCVCARAYKRTRSRGRYIINNLQCRSSFFFPYRYRPDLFTQWCSHGRRRRSFLRPITRKKACHSRSIHVVFLSNVIKRIYRTFIKVRKKSIDFHENNEPTSFFLPSTSPPTQPALFFPTYIFRYMYSRWPMTYYYPYL